MIGNCQNMLKHVTEHDIFKCQKHDISLIFNNTSRIFYKLKQTDEKTSYLISVFLSIYVIEINMFSCIKIIINKLASDKPDMTQPKRI